MENSEQHTYDKSNPEEEKIATDTTDAAVIFLNSKYKSSNFQDLDGVKDDGKFMTKMLQNAYKRAGAWIEIKTEENSEDIKENLEKFLTSPEIKGKHIRRLHVHFSGHGVFDKVLGENCLVGSGEDAKQLSEMDIKNMLLEWKSYNGDLIDEILLTIDCCRGNETLSRNGSFEAFDSRVADEDCKLERGWRSISRGSGRDHGAVSNVSNLKKVFTLYATPNKFKSSDKNSLTKELSAVTKEGTLSIAITELAREVNDSWNERGIDYQMSKDDYVKLGKTWKNCSWPVNDKENLSHETSSDEQNESGSSEERSNPESEKRFVEMEKRLAEMEKRFPNELQVISIAGLGIAVIISALLMNLRN